MKTIKIEENKMSEKLNLEQNNNKSSLADIILIISKHIILILILTILSTIITIIYVNKQYVPKYVSTATMFLADNQGANSGMSKIANQFGFSAQSASMIDISSSSFYPQIVESRMFAEIMLEKEFYSEKYGKKLPLIAIFTYGERPVPSNIDTLRISAANRISSMVKFGRVLGFFKIEVKTNEPQFSKDFADTMIVELDKLQRKFKIQTTKEKIEYIDQKIVLAKIELENSENKLRTFREKNRNISNSPGLLLSQERLQRDVEIQKGIFLTLKQQYELSKIEEVQKSSFVQMLDYPSTPIRESNPKKASTNIIGGLIGFFLGIALSFMIEYFKNRNDIEASKLRIASKNALYSIKKLFKFTWFKKNK